MDRWTVCAENAPVPSLSDSVTYSSNKMGLICIPEYIMQSEHYLSVAFFPWVEYVEMDGTTE